MRRLVGLLLASLLVLGALPAVTPGAAAAAAGNQSTVTPADRVEPSSEWSYDELSESGQQLEGKDPSSRYLGARGLVFVSYRETNVVKELSEMNEPKWAVDKVVRRDKTIDTQSVNMHVSRTRGAPVENVTVHVVQWEKQMRDQAPEDNRTEMEPVVVNATHQTHRRSLSGAGDTLDIPLPHTDTEKQVTIWIEEYPGARWVSTHDPVATTNALPFGGTWASFLPWFATRFLLLLAIGVPMAIGGAFKAVEKVGASPGKGMVWWIVVPGFLGYMAGYLYLGTIADLIVMAPWSMGLIVVGLAFVATAEKADRTKKCAVEQVTTEESRNALDEKSKDIVTEAGTLLDVVDLDGNGSRLQLVQSGSLKKWLLVALTDAEWPVLDLSEMESYVEYQHKSDIGEKVADMKLYVDDSEDELLRVRWPSVDISMSNLKERRDELPAADEDAGDPEKTVGDGWSQERVSSAFTAWGVGTILATTVVGVGTQAAAIGLVPAIYTVAKVRGSYAKIEYAPKHATKAKAIRVAETHEKTVADTFHEMQERDADDEADFAEVVADIVDSKTQRQRERLRLLLGVDESGAMPGLGRTDLDGPAGAAPDGGTRGDGE